MHRLNHELGLYQKKFTPLDEGEREEIAQGVPISGAGPVPAWLVDSRYLSPLLLSYDQQLKDKAAQLGAAAGSHAKLEAALQEVVEENERLGAQVVEAQAARADVEDWSSMREHARLATEESGSLALLLQEATAQSDRHLRTIGAKDDALAAQGERLARLQGQHGEQAKAQAERHQQALHAKDAALTLLQQQHAVLKHDKEAMAAQLEAARRAADEMEAKVQTASV